MDTNNYTQRTSRNRAAQLAPIIPVPITATVLKDVDISAKGHANKCKKILNEIPTERLYQIRYQWELSLPDKNLDLDLSYPEAAYDISYTSKSMSYILTGKATMESLDARKISETMKALQFVMPAVPN